MAKPKKNDIISDIEADGLGSLPVSVNVLGTEYSIEYVDENEDSSVLNLGGYCDSISKAIYLNAAEYFEGKKDASGKRGRDVMNMILRHEIVHAFFAESGLREECDFASNEILVDWIGNQMPKISKAMNDLNLLD